jgi:hypothetical protein
MKSNGTIQCWKCGAFNESSLCPHCPPTTKPIVKGSIVKYTDQHGDGWFRVSAIIAGSVNLKQIFGSHILHKRVPLAEVVEDEAAWYKNWQQSEAYQSM